MKHLFVPYELALLAKEKGFDEECLGCYSKHENEYLRYLMFHDCSSNSETRLRAPLYQQLVDWFRETHGIEVSVKSWKREGGNGIDYVYSNKKLGMPSTFNFEYKKESYYEALEAALTEAFKLI